MTDNKPVPADIVKAKLKTNDQSAKEAVLRRLNALGADIHKHFVAEAAREIEIPAHEFAKFMPLYKKRPEGYEFTEEEKLEISNLSMELHARVGNLYKDFWIVEANGTRVHMPALFIETVPILPEDDSIAAENFRVLRTQPDPFLERAAASRFVGAISKAQRQDIPRITSDIRKQQAIARETDERLRAIKETAPTEISSEHDNGETPQSRIVADLEYDD